MNWRRDSSWMSTSSQRTCDNQGVEQPQAGQADHLRPVFDNPRDTHLFFRMGEQLAQGHPPQGANDTIRLGRMMALQKPSGVRGIVAGDIVRRLVAWTMAQQLSTAVETATAPHQYAMSTRAGTVCVAHALQVLTELDAQATVVSIDGVGAYDSISRKALEALFEVPGGSAALPFVRLFCSLLDICGMTSMVWCTMSIRVKEVNKGTL